MAAPTKEEVTRRENIKDIGLFLRNNTIYDIFESFSEKLSKNNIAYLFSVACEIRVFESLIDLLLIWPQKGTKTTKIKFLT